MIDGSTAICTEEGVAGVKKWLLGRSQCGERREQTEKDYCGVGKKTEGRGERDEVKEERYAVDENGSRVA